MSAAADDSSEQSLRPSARRGFPAEEKSLAASTLGAVDRKIFSGQRWCEIAGALRLTRRELEIVQGVFDDATDLGIGQRMGISQHTVHTHLERMYHKLQVHSRPGLILRIVAVHQTLRDDGGDTRPAPDAR
jgi:DNA-binding CsgD family transcriptional regulator